MGLRPEDYNRLICCVAECETCGAQRGQVCCNEKTRVPYSLSGLMHTKRKEAAYLFRIHNQLKWRRLRQQIAPYVTERARHVYPRPKVPDSSYYRPPNAPLRPC